MLFLHVCQHVGFSIWDAQFGKKAAFAEPSMAEKAVKACWLDRSGYWVVESKCNSLQWRVLKKGSPTITESWKQQ